MEQVERKLASLTGLVQTALTSAVGVHVQLPDDDLNGETNNAILRIPPPEAGRNTFVLFVFMCHGENNVHVSAIVFLI